MPLHKQLVDLIHSKGGLARLHICGDTNGHLSYTLGTGTDILDVDTAVDLTKAAQMLGPQQCLCGNLDTSSEILFGKPENFPAAVRKRVEETSNRIILAAGCGLPMKTSAENIYALHDAVAALAK